MIFKALPVGRGDSFLLTKGEFVMLVDGGESQIKIASMVKKSLSGSHIDIVICTHYDSDHLVGLIGLMKSGIFINEVWLPDIYGDIALTLGSGVFDWIDLYKYINENDNLSGRNIIKLAEVCQKKNETIDENFINQEIEQNTYEQIDFKGLSTFILPDKYHYLYNLNFQLLGDNVFFRKLSFTISKISELITECYRNGSNIRWFKYSEKEKKNKINSLYSIFALNSYEATIRPYTTAKSLLDAIYYLTKSNKESLVYLFDESDFPNVLFTADSDLAFIKKNSYKLNDKSIVTAPHHGAFSNKDVYKIVKGNDLIYVRSDCSQTSRPCKDYTQLKRKYCTICRNYGNKDEVSLEYKKNNWIAKKQPCMC